MQIVNIQKKKKKCRPTDPPSKILGRQCQTNIFLSLAWGGQGGCERRITVFVKIQKKNLKFLNKFFGGVGGMGWVGGGGGGGGGGGSGWCWGVRVDVKEEFKFL